MGDPTNPKMTSLSLLPGCRFLPSEEQLVRYYLTHKNNDDRGFGFDVLSEIDLYSYDPFDLPETTCFRFGRGGRKRHWYCFTARVLKEGGRRRAGGGYWKSRGRVREVVDGGAGKVVVGTRRTFVFYLGDLPKTAVKTNWIMYEYALINHHKASFVLCRVFVRSRCGNAISDHVQSSCGEESAATVRHIGVQHDGTIHYENSDDRKNELLSFPMGLGSNLGDRGTGGDVSVAGFQLHSSTQPNEMVTSAGLASGGSMYVDGLAAQQLTAILEEDFIELDDLACPLSGMDYS